MKYESRDTFRCSACDYERVLQGRSRVYATPTSIRVVTWDCWCWECNEASLAEHLVPLPAIVAECNAWKQRDVRYPYLLHLPPMRSAAGNNEDEPEVLDYYDAVFAWRQMREAPGRCLYCGSTRVGFARERFSRFEHPHCGGLISHLINFGGEMSAGPLELFTSEGLSLGIAGEAAAG